MAKGKHFREEALLEKRSCVCQNRWQLVKRIRCCYYCLQRHFRLINPPPKNTDKHTHTTLIDLQLFLSSQPKNPASHRPCVTFTPSFFKKTRQLGSGQVSMFTIIVPNCFLKPHFLSVCKVWKQLSILTLRALYCFIFGSLNIYYKTKKLIKRIFFKGVKQGVGHYGHSGRGVNSFPPCRHVSY